MRLFIAIEVLLLLFCAAARAQTAGEITHLSGPVFAVKADGTQRALSVTSKVEAGDTLVTADKTYARVKFTDEGELTLRPGSQLKIESYSFDKDASDKDGALFGLVKGAMRAITGLIGKRSRNDAYRLNTTTATIGIRGTIIFAELVHLPEGLQTMVRFEQGFGTVAPLNAPQLLVEVPTNQTFGIQLGQAPIPVPAPPPGLQNFAPPSGFPSSSYAPPPPGASAPPPAPAPAQQKECIVR